MTRSCGKSLLRMFDREERASGLVRDCKCRLVQGASTFLQSPFLSVANTSEACSETEEEESGSESSLPGASCRQFAASQQCCKCAKSVV